VEIMAVLMPLVKDSKGKDLKERGRVLIKEKVKVNPEDSKANATHVVSMGTLQDFAHTPMGRQREKARNRQSATIAAIWDTSQSIAPRERGRVRQLLGSIRDRGKEPQVVNGT
jgi:hypothetical protein